MLFYKINYQVYNKNPNYQKLSKIDTSELDEFKESITLCSNLNNIASSNTSASFSSNMFVIITIINKFGVISIFIFGLFHFRNLFIFINLHYIYICHCIFEGETSSQQ